MSVAGGRFCVCMRRGSLLLARPFVALTFLKWHATGHSQPQLDGLTVVVPRLFLFLFLPLHCNYFESPMEQNLLACKHHHTFVQLFRR